MPNLLTIEANFLRQPEVSASLRLQEVRTIQRTITNAKKKKFEQSLALSQHVAAAFTWFKSPEGQSKFREEGITWSAEDFAQKVFGWQKSFFYKMVKVANVPAEVVDSYSAQADETAQRSVEELLSFAKQVEEGGSEGGQEAAPRAQVILSLSFNHPEGKSTLKIFDSGEVKITGNHIAEAIQFIQSSLNQ
jgi:adenine-specific DNA methylase